MKGGDSSPNQAIEKKEQCGILASNIAKRLPIRATKPLGHKIFPAADYVPEGQLAIKDQAELIESRTNADDDAELPKDVTFKKTWDPTFFQSNRSTASIGLIPLKNSLGKRRRNSNQEEDDPQDGRIGRKGVKAIRHHAHPPELTLLDSSKAFDV